MGMNIAIDGPAGAGKSTIAKRVAKEKGFIYYFQDTNEEWNIPKNDNDIDKEITPIIVRIIDVVNFETFITASVLINSLRRRRYSLTSVDSFFVTFSDITICS